MLDDPFFACSSDDKIQSACVAMQMECFGELSHDNSLGTGPTARRV